MNSHAPKNTGTSQVQTSFGTGITAFDHVLQSIMPGDNIVFQVDTVADYTPFVHPFCAEAIREKRELIYFRFADHGSLLPAGAQAHVYRLHPENGFESFLIEIHRVIEQIGFGACYVFDCLSELAVDWYTDRMLGNFFMLTCPRLYDFETATYFALLRGRHTPLAINAIHTTAQVVLDVYRHDGKVFLHPLKVWKRHTPTMYMLHEWVGDDFTPVTNSSVISKILSGVSQPWLDATIGRPDLWTRTFIRAREIVEEKLLKAGRQTVEAAELKGRLLRMVVSRDEQFLKLAEQYLTIPDLLDIGRRMIGTGLIGGKSAGMVLARAILRSCDSRWQDILEAHDSFYIGSDVFYTYLVLNGCWHVCRRERDHRSALDNADEAARRIRIGEFPDDIKQQFASMLDYFGQSPIIVRSSSLLEDAYGNAFSGKYESVFCANQGTPQERLAAFMEAVRTVYASTMSREALEYRVRRGLFDRDEQMALLIQRVSGTMQGNLYFPHMAGVGFSFNPYVWSPEIDPNEGFLRLVFGLGTRAVDRSGDDYTRLVSLNAPERRPEGSFAEIRTYAQRKVDVLDLERNELASRYFEEVAQSGAGVPLELFASCDDESERRGRGHDAAGRMPWVLTFEKVIKETAFIDDMRRMLRCLRDAYRYPVDIEFTVNFTAENAYLINLLQCRPFQGRGDTAAIAQAAPAVAPSNVFFATRGPIIGTSRAGRVDRLIFVVPEAYARLSMSERYSVARLIGRVTHAQPLEGRRIMLIGPGRWATTTPSLGVPVSFAEINTVSIICELALMHEGLVPDVSLGTHFFNDLVETDMLYCAVYPQRDGNAFNEQTITGMKNNLTDLLPDAASLSHVVHVIERNEEKVVDSIQAYMNSLTQHGVCYHESR